MTVSSDRVDGDLQVEQLDPRLFPLVNKFYKQCRYSAKAGRDDIVFVVRGPQGLMAAVRLQQRQPDVYFLRSMCVAPQWRRQGVGSVLLQGMQTFLQSVVCYCYPFDHLAGFYGQCGFVEVAPDSTEPYMYEPLQRYVNQGRKLLLMIRQPVPDH